MAYDPTTLDRLNSRFSLVRLTGQFLKRIARPDACRFQRPARVQVTPEYWLGGPLDGILSILERDVPHKLGVRTLDSVRRELNADLFDAWRRRGAELFHEVKFRWGDRARSRYEAICTTYLSGGAESIVAFPFRKLVWEG